MSIYQHYARFYDSSGQVYFALLMGQYLNEVLGRHPLPVGRALDLACGTGTLALLLAEAGWDVLGLDTSEAMLDLARGKATNLETPGRAAFVRGDMRDPASSDGLAGHWWQPGPRAELVDLITCTYDSLNYLTSEADLAACFRAAAGLLRAGGLLVADMNTRHFLEHDWGDHAVVETDGFVQVTQSYFDPATDCSTMVLTGFAGDDQQGYQRFDEVHVERAYPPEAVAALLEDAGLRVEASYDCFTFQPAYPRSQRIAWVARRI